MVIEVAGWIEQAARRMVHTARTAGGHEACLLIERIAATVGTRATEKMIDENTEAAKGRPTPDE